jgi:hypothetical protein
MQDGLIQLPDIRQEALLLLNRLLYNSNHRIKLNSIFGKESKRSTKSLLEPAWLFGLRVELSWLVKREFHRKKNKTQRNLSQTRDKYRRNSRWPV